MEKNKWFTGFAVLAGAVVAAAAIVVLSQGVFVRPKSAHAAGAIPTVNSFTVNGMSSIAVNVGDNIAYQWSSSNATSYSWSQHDQNGVLYPTCDNDLVHGHQDSYCDVASGSTSYITAAAMAGHTYTVTFTATNAAGSASASVTVIGPPTVNSFTVNGKQSIAVNVGDNIAYQWSSSNATSYSWSQHDQNGVLYPTCDNDLVHGHQDSYCDVASGSTNYYPVTVNMRGNTYTVTFTATNSAGASASASVTVIGNPTLSCTASSATTQTQSSVGQSVPFTLNASGGSGSYKWTSNGGVTWNTIPQGQSSFTVNLSATATPVLIDTAPGGGTVNCPMLTVNPPAQRSATLLISVPQTANGVANAGSVSSGSTWKLGMTSNIPSTSFNLCGIHNSSESCTPMGATDANGSWSPPLTGTFPSDASTIGSWTEWVCFGTVSACNSQGNTQGSVPISTSITFTVTNAPPPPPPAAVCGNGIVESGEQCDNGSANGPYPAACSSNCQLNTTPRPNPSCLFSASPSTVAPGGTATLYWNCQNVLSCTIGKMNGGAEWFPSGPGYGYPEPTVSGGTSSGSGATWPLAATTQFVVHCTNNSATNVDETATVTVAAPVTPLSASLSASPSSGNVPLVSTLSATAAGGSGTYNYTFWQDCSYSGTSVSAATSACGTPAKKDNGITSLADTAGVTYTQAGTFHPLLIVENGSSAVRATAAVTALGGGDSGYSCSNNCTSQISGGTYTTQSACQSACGGSAPLSATLSASPSSGLAPFASILTATAAGGSGTYNYTFWKDCSYSGTSVSVASSTCGTPIKKDNATSSLADTANATYQYGTHQPLVIVENGSSAVRATASVTASIPLGGCTPGAMRPCSSGANSCGMTNQGVETCGSTYAWGACSASAPPDSACGGYNCVNYACVYVSSSPAYATQSSCQATCIPPPVIINSFTPSTSKPIVPPETVTLSWTTSGANSCAINNGPTLLPNSHTTVAPTATTTYTLTCSGPGGSASKSLTVTVGGSGLKECNPNGGIPCF